ncbi:MAG TPA: serine hydrolase domain-containing protein, partial [Candidatus Baltobacteraceae bacterium]|nr:serine hydrolase domain-containing protein [Candidatus Baltobacteraceae bacterium]
STGKMFTAVAITQLVEQGKLSYNDTLSALLPAYHIVNADRITILQLLTHTSGLGTTFTDAFQSSKRDILSNGDWIQFFINDKPQFEPGKAFSYSNAGFVLLGAIIERITGKSYYDYVQQHIFAPAGMTHTTYDFSTGNGQDDVTGYGFDQSPAGTSLVPFSDTRKIRGSAAGGAWSTADDLARFFSALQDGRLVAPASYKRMIQPVIAQSPDLKSDQYGLGFEIYDRNGIRMFGHDGESPFGHTVAQVIDNKYTLIIMSAVPNLWSSSILPIEFLTGQISGWSRSQPERCP